MTASSVAGQFFHRLFPEHLGVMLVPPCSGSRRESAWRGIQKSSQSWVCEARNIPVRYAAVSLRHVAVNLIEMDLSRLASAVTLPTAILWASWDGRDQATFSRTW
jgi:hypothetical protein